MKLNAVSVIVFENDELQEVRSFSDDEGGNIQAEEYFERKVMGYGCPEEDVKSFIEDGYFCAFASNREVYLTHSE